MKLSKKNATETAAPTAEKKPFLSFSIGKKKTPTVIDPETFVFTPTLPKVNVIPPTVTEKYEIKGVARKIGFVIVGIVAVLGLLWAGGNWYVGTLNSQLETIKAEEAAVSEKVVFLTPFEEYNNAIEAKRTALSSAVSTDVNMSNIYADLFNTARKNSLSLSNITITQSDASADGSSGSGACINPDPFSTVNATVIGCIVMEGSGNDPEGSKFFVNDLAAISDPAKYVTPFISSVSTSEENSTFSATISFTDVLYTNQYADLKLSLAELLTPEEETPATDTPEEEETPATDTPESETTPQTEGTETAPAYESAVTTQAAELVPALSPDDLSVIDTAAEAACTIEDPTPALKTIENILKIHYPEDDPGLAETMNILTTTSATECEGA